MLHLDRKIGERILVKDGHGKVYWLIVSDVFTDRRGDVKVTLSFDGDRAAFRFTREELLTRDSLPPDQYREI